MNALKEAVQHSLSITPAVDLIWACRTTVFFNQTNVTSLLGESQVETIPAGLVTERKLYLHQIRRSQGVTSKAVTPPRGDEGLSF